MLSNSSLYPAASFLPKEKKLLNLFLAFIASLNTPITPLVKSSKPCNVTFTAFKISTASDFANSWTPPFASMLPNRNFVNVSVKNPIAGARAAVTCLVTPVNKEPNLVNSSLAFSTPFAASLDKPNPRALASPSISASPSRPWARVLTSAAPSESNSLNANLSLSDSFSTSAKASARTSILSSRGILLSF